jgi:calcium-dependent protein kinase
MKKGGLKDRYQIGKKIGEGGFGEVRFCREKDTKEHRAVKFLRKNKLSEYDTKQIMHEVKILSEMDHPNIVRLYEFYDEPKNYCLVQELCTGGELFDAIIKN